MSNDVQMVELRLPDGSVAQVVQPEVPSEAVESADMTTNNAEPQAVTLFMENNGGTQELISADGQVSVMPKILAILFIYPYVINGFFPYRQAAVGVIEQPQETMNQESVITTENLLGYLGEQLSAEALQPGNIVIIQNPDGTTTTVALSGAEGKEIPMETVQALLAMDPSAVATTQQQIE